VFAAGLYPGRTPERFPRIRAAAGAAAHHVVGVEGEPGMRPRAALHVRARLHARAPDAAMFGLQASGTDRMSTATAVKIPAGEQSTLIAMGARIELGERAWRGLLRTRASVVKLLDAELERAHGLPMSSYEVLHHLAKASRGRMRMRDLAEQAQLSRSGLTRLADRLERDGLLHRCSCDHDARGAYACLTDAGRERLQEARGTHVRVVREHFISLFTEGELRAMADMCERIPPCNGA